MATPLVPQGRVSQRNLQFAEDQAPSRIRAAVDVTDDATDRAYLVGPTVDDSLDLMDVALGSIVGIFGTVPTSDEKAALDGANAAGAGNVFATADDLTAAIAALPKTSRVLAVFSTLAPNNGTNETSLAEFTIPAGTLVNAGDCVRGYYTGIFQGNGSKQYTLNFNFHGSTVFSTGSFAPTETIGWRITVELILTNAATGEFAITLTYASTAALSPTLTFNGAAGAIGPGVNPATDIVWEVSGRVTGSGVGVNNIAGAAGLLEYVPAPA